MFCKANLCAGKDYFQNLGIMIFHVKFSTQVSVYHHKEDVEIFTENGFSWFIEEHQLFLFLKNNEWKYFFASVFSKKMKEIHKKTDLGRF